MKIENPVQNITMSHHHPICQRDVNGANFMQLQMQQQQYQQQYQQHFQNNNQMDQLSSQMSGMTFKENNVNQ